MLKRIVIGALILAAACKKDDGIGPDPQPGNTAGIVVSAVTSSMVVGTTQQMKAAVRGSDGKAAPSAVVTWTAEPVSVGTISSTGVLSAVAVGTVKVTGRSGNVSAAVDIAVVANPCTSPVSMSVGEVRTFSGASVVSCVTLAATTGASDFLVIGTNTSPSQDDLLSYSISPTAAASSAVSPDFGRALDPRVILAEQEASRVADLHERLRLAERRSVQPHLRAASRRMAAEREAASASFARGVSLAVAAQALGDTVTIRVPNLNVGQDICRNNIPIRGVVRAISSRATIVQDVTAPVAFTAADFTAIASEFDNLIYPTDTAWFGRPTDINNDGKITILYTPEVNKLTPPNASGFTAGFFFGSDLLKTTDFPASEPCRSQTNEQEIFYVLAPDPTGQFNNVRSTATVRQGTRGVIAHEFQHMINQSVRQYNQAVDGLETVWLNEAMSHLAEEVVGRAARGFGDFQSLSFSDVNPNPAQADDYNAFFRQNLSRFQRWMARPDTSAPVSAQNRAQLAPRGASWALLRYVVDQYSNGAGRAFTRALAAGPQVSVDNILARVKPAQFDQVISGWLVASYADNLGIAGLPARFSYTSWNMREVMTQSSGQSGFPLLVNTLVGPISTQVLSSSGNYFRLTRTTSSPATQLKMLAPGGGSLSSTYPTIILVRIG